ncbi:uncharacterized protein FSUBG_12073 [Fusarium subglutinans]|uniref:Uncharacterized protein n=1 Tax=Gibberella subglutinans TaxID=42677 RepID=A0A8H5P1R5_GIBSU|nr:uncharacterized protein FSUBG_12073 [Fusarium subglutinans]KAF5586614.1 hypothetical protein FSUBG_12073 [Fusarium subglutinans]
MEEHPARVGSRNIKFVLVVKKETLVGIGYQEVSPGVIGCIGSSFNKPHLAEMGKQQPPELSAEWKSESSAGFVNSIAAPFGGRG